MNLQLLLSALSVDAAVSGSALASRLGVTRAAVWKQMQMLRALGAPIQAGAGSGYRLAWPYEALDAQAILAGLDAGQRRRIGALDIHWSLDSTNSALLRRSAEDARDLLTCMAETQSAGRGRRGRAWVSPLGGNVYFSLLKRFEHGMGALGGLSLAAGVAVLQTLKDCDVAGVGLKWPNDVLVNGRKLAGILIELGGEYLGPCHAVTGIGINLRPLAIEAAASVQPSIDLATLMQDGTPSRNRLAGMLLARMIAMLDRFSESGFAGFKHDFEIHDVLHGRTVTIHTPQGTSDGIAAGVDDSGSLLVRHGAHVQRYDSAEVTVRAA